MGLLSLSLDVIRLILGHLSQHSLRAICLTNSNLHRIAETLLYSRIRLALRGASETRPHCITLLLRTLLARPGLATYIREISFGVPVEPSEPWIPRRTTGCRRDARCPVPDLELEAISGFVEKLEESGFSCPIGWTGGLQRGLIGAHLAVLLLNLSAVTALHIQESLHYSDNKHVNHALRSLLCDQPAPVDSLQNLRSVTLYRQVDTSSHLPLFYLPAVKQISVYFDDAIREFHWPNERPPSPSKLEILEVQHIPERFLGRLLSVTPSLRSLTWTRPYYVENDEEVHKDVDVYPVVFSLDDIMSSLVLVKDTLTELRIRTRDITDWWASQDASLARFTGSLSSLSLSEFASLKILEVPTVFVMGKPPDEPSTSSDSKGRSVLKDNLPPHLEELILLTGLSYIFVSHHEFYEYVEVHHLDEMLDWLENGESTLRLRRLVYLSQWTDEELQEEDDKDHLAKRHLLRDTTMKAGINFSFDLKAGIR